ncbi:MAG TPA: hypothetical protein VLB67_16135 [Acidimicrobiia bacterium]|nr:hypothetical protein [Acidimicrobiia bacterium]
MSTQTNADERRSTVIRTAWGFFANSIVAAALGVVFARIIEQFGIAVWGAIVGREPVLTHVVTYFRADGSAGSDIAFLGGPLAAILGGVFFLLIYPGAKDRSVGKLTVLWTVLFCFRAGFVDILTVPFSEESNTARALATIDLPDGLDVIIATAGGLGLVLIAVAAAPAFLGFSRHLSEVNTPRERFRYVASIAMVPAITGPLLAMLFFVPDQKTGFLASLPFVGLFVVITLLAAPQTKHFLAPQLAEERTLSWGLVVGFFVVFLATRYGLEPGLAIPPWDDGFQWAFRP